MRRWHTSVTSGGSRASDPRPGSGANVAGRFFLWCPGGSLGARTHQVVERSTSKPRVSLQASERLWRGRAGHRRIRRLAAYLGRGVTFHGVTFHVHAVAKGCPTWRQPPVPGKDPASTQDDELASSTAPVAGTA